MTDLPDSIALIATLDTKGADAAYVRDRIVRLGGRVTTIDSGILGEAVDIVPDVTRAEVAAAGGHDIDELRTAGVRGVAIERMLDGVKAVVLERFRAGRLAGAICLGGSEGALLGATAMQALPLGVPKLIVSPVASGRRIFGPLVGSSDMVVMHSVVDISGVNPVARHIYDNAAAAIVGMVRDGGTPFAGVAHSRCVGITMLGVTTPGVMALSRRLVEAGKAPVIFHANGVGGPAMESLAREGAFGGIVDFTLSELANTLTDGFHAVSDERLRVVGELGLPQVVVPGAVEFFSLGAPDTVPEALRSRRSYFHNPEATLLRLTREEMERLGAVVADRLNGASGPVHVVVPAGGFSLVGSPGGGLDDPAGDEAFLRALREGLRADIPYEQHPLDANAPAFADLVASRYLSLTREPASAA